MKKIVKAIILLLAFSAVAVSLGCASTPKQKETGFLDTYYKNLEPGPPGGVKMRWVNPSANFSKYNKLMIDSVIFYLSDESEDKGIDTEDMQELTETFNRELINALADKYNLTAEAGPGVVRIRVAITELKKSKPAMSAMSTVTPTGLGLNILKKGLTGSWSGSGKTGMEMMVLDPVTNEVLVVAQDERSADLVERFSKLASAKDAFKYWAGRVRIFIDNVHRVKQ